MLKKMPINRFIILDGMRGVAAFSVAIFHLYFYQFRIFNAVPILVDFFFVLSGFVLARSLMDTEFDFKKFLKSRIMRLYPAIFVAFLIILLTRFTFLENTSTASQYQLKYYLLAFLLLQAFISSLYPISVPLWSLSAELFVNVCAAFSFVKSKLFFIYFFIFFGLLLGILEEANLQFSEGKFFGNIDPNYSQISRAFLGFGLGLLLYAKNGQKSSKKVTRAPSVKSLSLICFFLCVEYALVVYSSKFIYFASPIFYFLIKLIIGIDQGIFPHWMLTVCSKLGRISYGVYVFHTPVSQLFSGEFFTKYLGFNLIEPQFLILGFILKLLLTIIVAELSLRLVEIPMKKWSKW